MVYSFSSFGFEGSIVTVETDLRRGIPSVDIVGLADGPIKESRERMRSAIINSGFEFPQERVLISLSPADLKKEGAGFDLPIAVSIMNPVDTEKVMVMGELELSGHVRPVRGVYAALESALESGIRYAIIPKNSEDVPDGIEVYRVETLSEALDAYEKIQKGQHIDPSEDFLDNDNSIKFRDIEDDESTLDNLKGLGKFKRAMTIAVAGKLNLLAIGKPGCGKTAALQCMGDILPLLTNDEKSSVQRLYSLAGLLGKKSKVEERPFRMPHQTASIEGICGGGVHCLPGEISLAHNGVLFLDEAAEFRSSVLQMLRVPIETKSITLCRAGRSTTYPANFQLVMATNPCPCGNFGNSEKICLCSARSVEQYWRKFGSPLLDRVEIRYEVDPSDESEMSIAECRELVKTAWTRQQKRKTFNRDLTSESDFGFSRPADEYFFKIIENYNASAKTLVNIKKVARTIADMEDEDFVLERHVKEAVSLTYPNILLAVNIL